MKLRVPKRVFTRVPLRGTVKGFEKIPIRV